MLMRRFFLMCASVGVSVAALAAMGCGRIDDSDGFRGGVPTRDTVALRVPGADASGALTASGEVQAALLGQKADTYVTTRAITAVVNGGTYAVLTLVRTIIDFPATTATADTAVWGPHTEPLSPNTWRLTVIRVEPQKFQWLLEARAKAAPDSAFVAIISGVHTPAVGADGRLIEGFGSGTFTVDWDASQTLPEHDKNVGKAAFTYSRLGATAVVSIDVDFKGIQDDKTGEIHDALYRYSETPGAGGDLQYVSDQDVTPGPGPTGTVKEHFTVHSRWQETGAGRCDLRISGGDLTATPFDNSTGSECWDEGFASVYRNLSYDPNPVSKWGDEASCVFTPASYATL
jgi:hypothetical protein